MGSRAYEGGLGQDQSGNCWLKDLAQCLESRSCLTLDRLTGEL